MKNITLHIIIDNVFKFVLLFLVNLIWCYYIINKSYPAVFVSIIISLVALTIINFISTKKRKKTVFNIKEAKRIEDIKNTFLLMSDIEILNFFYNLASAKHKVNKTSKYLEIETSDKPIILIPKYKSQELNLDDILPLCKMIKSKNIKKLLILTNTYNDKVLDILHGFDFKIEILSHKNVYFELLRKYEFYPKITYKEIPKQKNTIKKLILISIDKKRTKSYIISALCLFFSSFFVKFKIYYLIFSTVLLLLALLSRFNFDKPQKENLLS